MLDVLTLGNGKVVSLAGDSITREEAIEIASRLLERWGQVHPKAKAVMLYEVEPKHYSECPHYPTLEDGLEEEGYT